MKNFPFISLNHSLVVLRVFVALMFIAHAFVRVVGGTVDRFGDFLNNRGFVMGLAIVWGITVFELLGGATMALGYFTKWLATAFILMLLVGIFLIHIHLGWFVGEHGTGGMEYSAVLMVCLLVIAAADGK